MITRLALRATTLTLVAGALAAGVAAPAGAGAQFGHHVSGCAQSVGFDGVHNPGMHRGYSGWSGDHAC